MNSSAASRGDTVTSLAHLPLPGLIGTPMATRHLSSRRASDRAKSLGAVPPYSPPKVSAGGRSFEDEQAEMNSVLGFVDNLLTETAEMRVAVEETARLEQQRRERNAILLHSYDLSVRQPIGEKIRRQLSNPAGASGRMSPDRHIESAVGGGDGSMPMSRLEAMDSSSQWLRSVIEENGRGAAPMQSLQRGSSTTSSGASSHKLRDTMSPTLWKSAEQRIHLYDRSPALSGVSGKQLISTLRMDDFAAKLALTSKGRDAALDTEFPRGKKTYEHRATFSPS